METLATSLDAATLAAVLFLWSEISTLRQSLAVHRVETETRLKHLEERSIQ